MHNDEIRIVQALHYTLTDPFIAGQDVVRSGGLPPY
jgi:hypothetical protein